MLKTNLLTVLASVFLFSLLLVSCESDSGNHEEQVIDTNTTQDESESQRAAKVKKIFYTIPSPVEMAAIIKKSGASFDKAMLNDVNKANNYTGAKSQALNLGIYGADLSYSSMFDQNQEAIYFLSASQKLAKDLGVEDAIDGKIIERMNNNTENRDSLLQIMSEAYWSLNGYLKKDGREEISGLVIAGGWVEGLHLACSHLTPDNMELKKRIAEQKYALKDLISLLKSYEGKEILDSIVADLESVQEIFNGIKINKGKTETSQDESGTTVIGGKASIEMTDEQLAQVAAKISEMRAQYIQ
ncbi:MAG: hypothetical protein KDC12_13985 [Flavobacteriales bacterium]|nr:hypothetical protein [Flavobacteriales bacterium]